jgi:P27 family predicted phage terminase small subunit
MNPAEPQPPEGKPQIPTWLTDEIAVECWHRTFRLLDRMGLATKADAAIIARYCSIHARWRRVQEFLQTNGEVYTIKDEKGQPKYVQQWPQVNIAAKLADQLLRIELEYGLTPSARTRIAVAPTLSPQSPLEGFLRINGKPAPATSAG